MTIREHLADDATKKKVAKAINDAVDIPMISEKTEGKIANKVVNLVFDAMADSVEDIVG